MAFEIIKAETIVARMIIWFGGVQNKIIDFLPGAKTRTKFEALAVEIEYQYTQFYGALKKAIATAIYTAFGFTLRPPVAASGYVTFNAAAPPTQDIPIVLGSQVSSATQTYVTTAAATLLSGETTVIIPVVCVTAGIVGNTDIGTINTLKTAISGVTSVANAAPLANGLDWETEDQRKNRFLKFIASLSRATDAANAYAATTARLIDGSGNITELVVDAIVVGPPVTDPGYFTVYIWNGIGNASNELCTEAKKIIDGYMDSDNLPVAGYKAAGDVSTVTTVTTLDGDVTMIVIPAATVVDETALRTLIQTTVATYIQGLGIGQAFSLNEMIRRVKNLPGVSDFTVSAHPTEVPTVGEIYVPGTITVDFP
jgi:uncharacterized phage protein gp47/JayE